MTYFADQVNFKHKHGFIQQSGFSLRMFRLSLYCLQIRAKHQNLIGAKWHPTKQNTASCLAHLFQTVCFGTKRCSFSGSRFLQNICLNPSDPDTVVLLLQSIWKYCAESNNCTGITVVCRLGQIASIELTTDVNLIQAVTNLHTRWWRWQVMQRDSVSVWQQEHFKTFHKSCNVFPWLRLDATCDFGSIPVLNSQPLCS